MAAHSWIVRRLNCSYQRCLPGLSLLYHCTATSKGPDKQSSLAYAPVCDQHYQNKVTPALVPWCSGILTGPTSCGFALLLCPPLFLCLGFSGLLCAMVELFTTDLRPVKRFALGSERTRIAGSPRLRVRLSLVDRADVESLGRSCVVGPAELP